MRKNAVVIMDKEQYIEGIKNAVSDANKFVQSNIVQYLYQYHLANTWAIS